MVPEVPSVVPPEIGAFSSLALWPFCRADASLEHGGLHQACQDHLHGNTPPFFFFYPQELCVCIHLLLAAQKENG